MSTANPERFSPNRNSLKQRLLAGEKVYGAWNFSCNPINAQILGLAGFDFVIIDLEHGPGNVWSAVQELNALEVTKAAGVIRSPWNDVVMLKKIMDIGPAGVLIPFINNKEDAEKAVAAVTYAPNGNRGCAYPLARASFYGFDEDYQHSHMKHTLIGLQIETLEGVRNIEEIASVPGVDMLFIGPRDLSGTMGILGEFENEDLIAEVRKAEKMVVKSGVLLGSVVPRNDDAIDMFKNRGYSMLAGAADTKLLKAGAEANIKHVRSRL